MAICADETYWVDGDAAQPVLLIDEATEVITEALHRARCGSMLDNRDLTAAGVALCDLFGGLGQLADLLTTSVAQRAETDPLQAGRLEDRLNTLREMTLAAQRSAEELLLETAAIPLTHDQEKIPVPRCG